MNVRHFILATAGHVDHGKSTIVRALTGTDPDRLPEEKSRGMTIDLGFASFSPSPDLSIGIVDVPGHEDFVCNMVAGVGAIDAALLVIAADDGWMPQSEEHLRILSFLNIRHGLIVLTKIDRVDSQRIQTVMADVRRCVKETFLTNSPIALISVPAQLGLDKLKSEIVRLFDRVPFPVDIGKPRLQIDRSFVMRGAGRIVTGTLSGGILMRGQTVTLAPAQKTVKIRAIQSHNRDVAIAEPGMRVALNIPELDSEQEWRGQTVTLDPLSAAHEIVDVQLLPVASTQRLRRGVTLHVHHGACVVEARAYPFGETHLRQLRLQSPLHVFVGDRLILRDAADRSTLGGAIVLDPSARRNGMSSAHRQLFLNRCAQAIEDAQTVIEATVEFVGTAKQSELLGQSNFSIDAIATAIKSSKALLARSGFVLTRQRWSELLQRLGDQIRSHHRDHPEQSGLTLSTLRATAGPLFDSAVEELMSSGFVRLQTVIRASDHRPALPPRLQPAGVRLRSLLEQRLLDPPTRSELAPDALSQQALTFLKINGEVVELSSSVFISAAAFHSARQRVMDFLRLHGQGTVTELKSAMGTSRRVAVPLLEHLDQAGVTRRTGDLRGLR